MANEFVINTELNTDGVVTGAEEIKKQLESAGANGAEAGRKLGQNIEKGLTSALSNVKDSMDKALVFEDGGNAEMGIQSLIDVYMKLKEQMDAIGAKRDDILNQQSAIADNVNGDLNTRYYKELEDELAILDSKYGQFGERVETIGEALKNAGVDLETLGQEENSVADNTEKANEAVEKQSKKFIDLGKSAKSAEKHVNSVSNSFKKGLSKLLKYAFGISTLFVLFNKLRGAVKEGFSNLAESDENVKNAINDLNGSLGQFKNQIASAFQPILTMVAPIISKFIQMLTQAMTVVSSFFAMLSGQGYINKAIKQTNELADGFGASAKKAKELKNYTSGLDELNVISPQEDEAGGGGGASGADMFEQVPIDPAMVALFDELKNKAQAVLDRIKPLWDLFKEGFSLSTENVDMELLADKIKHVGELLKDIFTDEQVMQSAQQFAEKFAKALGQFTGAFVSIGYTIALNIVGGLEKYLEENSDRIKSWLSEMFEINGETIETWGNFAETVADIFSVLGGENGQAVTADIFGIIGDSAMGASELVSKLVRDISEVTMQPIIDNADSLKNTFDGLLGDLDTVLAGVKNCVDSIWDSLNSMYDESLKPFFDGVASGISDSLGKFLTAYDEYVKPFVDAFAENVGALFDEHLAPAIEKFIGWVGAIVEQIKAVWDYAKPFIDWIIKMIVQYVFPLIVEGINHVISVISVIIDIVGDVFQVLQGVIDFIVGVFTGDWEKAWNGVQEIFEGVVDALEDIWNLFSETFISIFEGMWDGLKAVLNIIIEGFEGLVNGVIDAVNGIIDALNSLEFEVPDWIPEIGGETFSLGLEPLERLSIPRLASGAVIPPNKEFMAVLGDQHNGTNIEAPLDTIKQALIEALDDSSFISYLASISDYTRATSEKDMTVRIGDRDIARANIRGQKQMGRTLITSV